MNDVDAKDNNPGRPPGPTKPNAPKPRSRIAKNIVTNWLWYVVVVIAGFLLPRFIDQYRGRDIVGIWDLGWSLVAYVHLLAMGITSAVNRFTARYRESSDWDALNGTIVTCIVILSIAAALGMILAAVFAESVHVLVPKADAESVRVARSVVWILCLSAAIQLPGGVFNAIITGYERFDLLNVIRGMRDVAAFGINIFLLARGNGLVALATTILIAEVFALLCKIAVAYHLFPHLRLTRSGVRWKTMKRMFVFGGKTVAEGAARSGLYQLSGLLVAYFLGPGFLAVFARQRALVMHAMRFVTQYAQVFVPTSSLLHARGDADELRKLLVKGSRYGFHVAFPIVLVLIIMGKPLLNVWMGEDYEAPWTIAILAAGHLLAISQRAVYSLLMGMGRHGIPAAFELVGAIVSVALGVGMVGFAHWGLPGAAIAVGLPVTVTSGILLPTYACRLLNIRPASYWSSVIISPLLTCVPMALCLGLTRAFWNAEPWKVLIVGMMLAAIVTIPIYWIWVVPPSIKNAVIVTVQARLGIKRRHEQRLGT